MYRMHNRFFIYARLKHKYITAPAAASSNSNHSTKSVKSVAQQSNIMYCTCICVNTLGVVNRYRPLGPAMTDSADTTSRFTFMPRSIHKNTMANRGLKRGLKYRIFVHNRDMHLYIAYIYRYKCE